MNDDLFHPCRRNVPEKFQLADYYARQVTRRKTPAGKKRAASKCIKAILSALRSP